MTLANLRIRGMLAMRYTVNLRALGLNIRRCAAVGGIRSDPSVESVVVHMGKQKVRR